MCQLPFKEHVEAVTRFVNDTEGYEDNAPRYKVRYDQESRASIMDKRTGVPIAQGCNMNDFNNSFCVWWDERHANKVPF